MKSTRGSDSSTRKSAGAPSARPNGARLGKTAAAPSDDKARSNIAQVIADNLDISYGEDECQQFAETIQFALANGVPVDLDVVLDGCHRAIDDLDTWAEDDVKEPLLRLREELLRMQGEQ